MYTICHKQEKKAYLINNVTQIFIKNTLSKNDITAATNLKKKENTFISGCCFIDTFSEPSPGKSK